MDNGRRFYRNRTDKVIAGVAGGLGQYFNIDPLLVRVLFLVLLFLGGASFFIYVILWVIAPLDPATSIGDQTKNENENSYDRGQSRIIIGAMFIVVGIIILFKDYLDFIEPFHVIAGTLIVIGSSMLFRHLKKIKNEDNNHEN